MQYGQIGRRATAPVLIRAYSRISVDEHVGIANFDSPDTPPHLLAVAQLGDHASDYEDASPTAVCSQEERDAKSPSAAPVVEHAAPRIHIEECLLGDVERAGLMAQQKRFMHRRALSVPAGVIDHDAGHITEIDGKPNVVENLLHQLRRGRPQVGSSDDVTVVQDADGVDVAEWRERIEEPEAEGNSAGKIRKYRERLSSGASSVKAGMRKAVKMVSKVVPPRVVFHNDELTTFAQVIRQDSAIETNEKVQDGQPLLPHPSSSPPPYSSLSAPTVDEVHPRRTLATSDAANGSHEISSPPSLSYGCTSRPNENNVCGPDANLAQVDINVSDFWARFTERHDRGHFENVRREAYFDAMPGNCTTEAEQLEADKSHQRQARLERQKREDDKMIIQVEARVRVSPANGITAAAQRPIRSPALRRMNNYACVARIMGEASMRSGFGELY